MFHVEQFQESLMKIYDVLIVGGGHAGIEAAYIASQFGLDVAIVTMPGVPLGSAPCNPSVGGVGKGQVVRELDALGGLMGFLADRAGIQFRTLNDSKGFAVQSSRVQIDKEKYSIEAEEKIRVAAQQHAIFSFEKRVDSLILSGAKDRATAIRWIHEAEDTQGDDEYLCYTLGLPYQYFRKVA
jgi:tRNA uridine 5-carboxymethylaminomethyl modification enzyme